MAVIHGTNGDDTLIGTAGENNSLFGYLGDDLLVGAAGRTNWVYGDWQQGTGSNTLGDDLLVGGENATNYLYGDAHTYTAHGGDDRLVAGAGGSNYLYGDAYSARGACGNDTLVGSTGSDQMWGDARVIAVGTVRGADTFVFDLNSGRDVINDFEQGRDLIDLSALGLMQVSARVPIDRLPAKAIAALQNTPLMRSGFDVLDSNGNGALDDGDAFVAVTAGGAVIDLGAAAGGTAGVDTLTVVGQVTLVEADFVF